MQFFKFTPDINKFECIAPASPADDKAIQRIFEVQPLAKKWKPPSVRRDSRFKAGDFPSFEGPIPVFSERAWIGLQPLIDSAVEALPIKHPSGDKYFAIHVLDVVDALDRKKSAVKLYADGGVMRVVNYCFKSKPLKGKQIFRIPESVYLEVLVSETFKKRVEELKLKGILFQPLP
jgi:hypothetical protein